MDRTFAETLLALRQGRNLSQRTAAADLGISQPLLSHYEKGTREPGLNFVCRACDYYGVSADYLLGRSDRPDAAQSAVGTAALYLDRLQELIGEARAAIGEYAGKENDR